MLNTQMLKKYARKYLARKKIREKDTQLTEELEKMQKVLLDHMGVEEIQKFSFKGGITVSIKKLIWGKYNDRALVIKALKKAGLGDMVSEGFNAQTIASYLREMDKAERDLPKEFKGVLEANRVQTLTVKKM
jgi:hypothetical protein